MFEQEIDRVRKELRKLLATPQQFVLLDAIEADQRLHPAFRKYFRAEVEWWIHEEQSIRSSNPRFDIADPTLQTLLSSLDSASIRAARFDHEELNATIDSAVKTRVNMLCRPRTTLKWFVFRGEPTRPIREVLLRLNYLYDYPYIIDGFKSWADGRGKDASLYEILSVVEFERIVEKIDNDAILDLSQAEFVAMLDPLFEFFTAANPDLPPETVSTEAVIIFLDDKGAVPISQALERLLYREQMAFVTRTKLVDIINDVIRQIDSEADGGDAHTSIHMLDTVHHMNTVHRLDEEVRVMNEPIPDVQPVPVMEPPAVNVAAIDVSSAELSVMDVPVDTQVEFIQQDTLVESTSVVDALTDTDVDNGIATEPQIVAQQRAVQLDDHQKRKMLKKFFRDNEADFDEFIQNVLQYSTWKEAAASLDRKFALRGIEPNSTLAMELAQAIHRAYL